MASNNDKIDQTSTISTSKKRELIKEINNDPSLSESEKKRKIQELMMGNYLDNLPKSESNYSKTCEHYEKFCYKFRFDCCGIYDPCKRCHKERNCPSKNNLIVQEITCTVCEKSQESGEFCIGCGIKFSKSYCGLCQIWTSKDITHCNKCGSCRVSKSEDLLHCDNCGICFHKSGLHTCRNNKTSCKDAICAVCTEEIFNSQSGSYLMECSHFVHTNCFKQYISSGYYKCPLCKKSMINLKSRWILIREQIKLNPLPNDFFPISSGDIVDSNYGKFLVKSIDLLNGIKMYHGEFVNLILYYDYKSDEKNEKNEKKVYGTLNENSVVKNIYKNIHCNDCGQNSTLKFHPYGLECVYCGSFNTQE